MERSTEHVPADLLPGLLEVAPGEAWQGPAEVVRNGDWRDATMLDVDPHGYTLWVPSLGVRERLPSEIRLPLTRPEGRAQLARVLTRGWCNLHKRNDPHDIEGLGPNGTGYFSGDNPESTGHLRCHAWRRNPVRHLLPSDELGSLPSCDAQHSAALLACSAWRTAAGMGPVRGIDHALSFPNTRIAVGDFAGERYRWASGMTDGIHEWEHSGYAIRRCRHCHSLRPQPGHEDYWRSMHGGKPYPDFDSTCTGAVLEGGFGWMFGMAKGAETGAMALSILHSRALALGYAIVSPAGLSLPWPPEATP